MSLRATWAAMFEPERYPPPPLTGFGFVWRYAVSIGVFIVFASVWLLAFQSRSTGVILDVPLTQKELENLPPVWWVVLDPVLGAIGLSIIHLRRRHPLAIVLITAVFSFFSSTIAAVAVWAYISNASRRNLNNTLIAFAVTLALGVADFLLPWSAQLSWSDVAITGVVTVLFTLWGKYLGVRRDQASGFLRRVERAEAERQFAVLAERNRIAREMHDVLAHRISLVSMHAGVLAYRSDLPPEKTREIASIIQENAHASLTELRSVLSTLREGPSAGPQAPEGGDAASGGTVAAPQPTLANLPALLEEVRASGQQLEASITLDPSAVPLVQQRHLYRIVQECLTNARKHAQGALVELELSGGRREGISLRCSNLLTDPNLAIPGSKLGLVGVTERAQMLGGRLDAGVQGGRFVVDAWLPWDHDFRRTA
ncbi:MAG: histidine kinase [Propionibacteriaceae bacterium]|nr:histidine kinase [Propionibacteriaceae bacterium]